MGFDDLGDDRVVVAELEDGAHGEFQHGDGVAEQREAGAGGGFEGPAGEGVAFQHGGAGLEGHGFGAVVAAEHVEGEEVGGADGGVGGAAGGEGGGDEGRGEGGLGDPVGGGGDGGAVRGQRSNDVHAVRDHAQGKAPMLRVH